MVVLTAAPFRLTCTSARGFSIDRSTVSPFWSEGNVFLHKDDRNGAEAPGLGRVVLQEVIQMLPKQQTFFGVMQ